MKVVRNLKSLCVSVVLMIGSLSISYGQEWETVLNPNQYSIPHSIVQTPDSSYWIGGTLYGGNGTGSILIKLNSLGDTIFIKKNISIFHPIHYIASTKENGIIAISNEYSNLPQIRKVDKNGDVLWVKQLVLPNIKSYIQNTKVKEIDNADIFVATHYRDSTQKSNVEFRLYDKLGNEKWIKKHQFNNTNTDLAGFTFEEKSFYLHNEIDYNFPLFNNYINKVDLIEFDYEGNFKNRIEQKIDTNTVLLKKLKDENLLTSNLANWDEDLIIKKVKNNTTIWQKTLALGKDNIVMDLTNLVTLEKENKDIVLVVQEYSRNNNDFFNNSVGILVLDSLGNKKSFERWGGEFENTINSMIISNDGYYVVCGEHEFPFGINITNDSILKAKIRIIKTKALALSSAITGKVIIDSNANCQADSLEKALKTWNVEAQNTNGETFYGISQQDGTFDILASGDSLTLTTQTNSPYYKQVCTPTGVKFSGNTTTLRKDIMLQKNTDCPYLTIDLATRALRPCFDAVQVVNFCNHGSATAQNAYVEVQLDANLTYLSSTKTAVPKGNNLYRFDLGDLPVDSCGSFVITTKMACDNSLLGKTLCNSVHIYPDSLCTPIDNGKIKVTGTCNGTTIQFDIKNDGTTPMNANKNYIIIEDHVMYMQGNFNLNPNEVKPIIVTAKAGKTYRLIAEQTNPIYGNLASAAFENCNASATPTTGVINQFSQGDDSPFEDVDCRVVTASYDPNDKQAVPEGVQNQHFIAKNTDLEYMIRFQNKGTDTAFLVIVKDTLSQFLDPASIVPGASSHPYKFDLTDRGIAKFIFTNINLPHEKADKDGSNGFVKFRIKQRRDLPNGTVINNKAAIYFDYNDPIITNQTFHTIGENWMMILPNKETQAESIDIKVFPNPFSESTRIEAQLSEEHNNLIFNLLDANGRVIRSENFTGNALDFQRNGLQNGFYFYEIKSQGKRLGTGKLVIF